MSSQELLNYLKSERKYKYLSKKNEKRVYPPKFGALLAGFEDLLAKFESLPARFEDLLAKFGGLLAGFWDLLAGLR